MRYPRRSAWPSGWWASIDGRRRQIGVEAMSSGYAGGHTHMAASVTYFGLGAAITRAEISVVCAEVADLVRASGAGVVVCDLASVTGCDVVTVEALARLRVTGRRNGWRLVVSRAGPDLVGLVRLLGLTEALLQAGRQPEQRKKPGSVEEVVDGTDPPC